MPELVKVPRYKVGDKVRVVFGARLVGTVTEARGTYTETANILYRVRVPMEEEPLWLLMLEDEIEKV